MVTVVVDSAVVESSFVVVRVAVVDGGLVVAFVVVWPVVCGV